VKRKERGKERGKGKRWVRVPESRPDTRMGGPTPFTTDGPPNRSSGSPRRYFFSGDGSGKAAIWGSI